MKPTKVRYRIEKKGDSFQLFLVCRTGDLMWIATRDTAEELRKLVGVK